MDNRAAFMAIFGATVVLTFLALGLPSILRQVKGLLHTPSDRARDFEARLDRLEEAVDAANGVLEEMRNEHYYLGERVARLAAAGSPPRDVLSS